MRSDINIDQYERLVREMADSIGIEPLEITTPSLRRTLHLRFNDVRGRQQDVFVPMKTSPASLQAMLRSLYGRRPRSDASVWIAS
jgi:hypothetical protein